MENTNSGKQNNGSKLAKLDWPTLVLIALTGGGNFLANQQGKSQLSYEQQEAIAKIREIHTELDKFERGMETSLNNQSQLLNNQTLMLQDQAELLAEMHKLQKASQ
jgi:hypothetical protein